MDIKTFFLFFALQTLAIGCVQAEPVVPVQPKPSWVLANPRELSPDIPHDEISSGVYYVLVDNQAKIANNANPEFFSHYATYIVNQNGLEESSQINIDFDPTYESVVLHNVVVWRGGKAINKIDSATMSLLQREQDLDKRIYNGEHTLNIILDDVRIGDTIEYSYTTSGFNPIFGGVFGYAWKLQWSVPVHYRSLRVLWQKPQMLQYKVLNSDFEIQRRRTAAGVEYWGEQKDIAALPLDGQTPWWFNPYATVYFSELSDWRDVLNRATPLFADAVNSAAEVNAVASDIRSKHKEKDKQIAAALRFVQEQIRYLGIEIGENSHRPSPADVTLKRRYGDCKDKTVLLIALLNALGVEAYPALVNTTIGKTLTDVLPMINIFDHVIVKIEHDQHIYWIDPTRQYQYGGLKEIYQPDFGFALVVKPAEKGLTAMAPEQAESLYTLHDVFDLTAGEQKPVVYSIHSEYQGLSAERQRENLARDGLNQVRNNYLEFYKDYYRSIEVVEPAVFQDDQKDNKVIADEKYVIPSFWERDESSGRDNAHFYVNGISPHLREPEQINRRHPYALSYPMNIQQTIEVRLHDDNWYFEGDQFVEDNVFFKYESRVSYDQAANILTLMYHYASKTDFVPPDQIERYVQAIKRANNDAGYGIYRSVNNAEAGLLSGLSNLEIIWLIIAVFIALLLLVFILWRMDVRRNPFEGESIYYPVALTKLAGMWLITFGVYGIYWFYRNWRYVKLRDHSSIMPVARGIFNQFWFYPLYADLRKDSQARFNKSYLPAPALGVVMAIIYFVFAVVAGRGEYTIPVLVVSVLFIVPLANYINYVNKDNSEARAYNSKWRFRHYLLSVLCLPLLLMTLGSELGVMPSEAVVKGDTLFARDLKFMQRKGVVEPGDEIVYFYSDAFFSIRSDGNGFSRRHVFSYWEDERGVFNYQVAAYDDIDDIEVTWSTSFSDNTLVNIIRRDKSSFLLYVSSSDGKDKAFVNRLRALWKKRGVTK